MVFETTLGGLVDRFQKVTPLLLPRRRTTDYSLVGGESGLLSYVYANDVATQETGGTPVCKMPASSRKCVEAKPSLTIITCWAYYEDIVEDLV